MLIRQSLTLTSCLFYPARIYSLNSLKHGMNCLIMLIVAIDNFIVSLDLELTISNSLIWDFNLPIKHNVDKSPASSITYTSYSVLLQDSCPWLFNTNAAHTSAGTMGATLYLSELRMSISRASSHSWGLVSISVKFSSQI